MRTPSSISALLNGQPTDLLSWTTGLQMRDTVALLTPTTLAIVRVLQRAAAY
jgi:hypothetical protein